MKTNNKKQKPDAPNNPDVDGQIYVPPVWGSRYVMACLDIEIKPTITGRCAAADVPRSTFYDHWTDDRFVAWLTGEVSKHVGLESREVRTALLRLCIKGDLEAIRLWQQRYDEFIPTSRQIIDGDLTGTSYRELADLARGLADASDGASRKVH